MKRVLFIIILLTVQVFPQVPTCGNLPAPKQGKTSYLNVAKAATSGDGTDESPYAGWEDAVNAQGDYSQIDFPAGRYTRTKPISAKRYWNISGAGKGVTRITSYSTSAGDAIVSQWPSNCSTAIYLQLHDLTLEHIDPGGSRLHANNAFVDVGGSYLTLYNLQITGFNNGVIFDQSEVFSFSNSVIEDQGTRGVWIGNGGEFQTGNAGGYTNVITLREMAFNEEPQAVGLVVNGCYTLRVVGSSFNGGRHAMWLAGIQTGEVTGNHVEGSASDSIVTAYYAYGYEPGTGHDKGANYNLAINNNTVVNGTNAPIRNGYFQVGINNLLSTNGYSIKTGWNIVPPILLGNLNSYAPPLIINDKSTASFFWLNNPAAPIESSQPASVSVTVTQLTPLPTGTCEDIEVGGLSNLTLASNIQVNTNLAGTRVADQTTFTPIIKSPTTLILRRCNNARSATLRTGTSTRATR